MIEFTVPGRPVPLARARVTRSGHAYTPEKSRVWKEKAGWCARAAMGPLGPTNEKVKLFARFYLDGGRIGDADNYLKALCDSLNGIAWDDDRQVRQIEASIIEGTPERTEVRIVPIGNGRRE